MKTITIPKRFGYPTAEITINGKEQTFASGVEISVEDSVAEAIENAIALAPKFGINISKLAQRANGSLTELTLSDLDGIKSLVSSAFSYCKSLTSVEIPESITSIGASAFYNCPNLESVRFGTNGKLASIGSNAFKFCGKLKSVYLPMTPPTLEEVNVFQDSTSCVFYCKSQASLDAYKKAANWSTLTGTYSFVVEEKNG